MNKILQKRIEEAAKEEREQCREDNNEIWRGNPTYNDVEASFIKGAAFALQNQWISVEEALPQKDDLYFVLIDSLHPRVTEFENSKWQGYDNITHWMENPKLKDNE